MLARVYIKLPFSITVQKEIKYPLYDYSTGDYRIRIYPPKTDKKSPQLYEEISIDGVPAIQADILHLDFYKDDFVRSITSSCDPPPELINYIANLFLMRLRYVTRSTIIRPIDFPEITWNLLYLNDDESDLEETPGLLRNRFGREFKFSWVALNPQIWKDVHTLPGKFIPPHWDTLLLDAFAAIPDVGLSIVLASTALEVFISHVLNKLAERSTIPSDIWDWINQRAWLKEPSVEEQFGSLLKVVGGFSLMDNTTLWEAFKNLRSAKNSFVHEGEAIVGKKPVTKKLASELVTKASQTIAYIKEKLPKELHWPEFKHKVQVKAKFKLFGD